MSTNPSSRSLILQLFVGRLVVFLAIFIPVSILYRSHDGYYYSAIQGGLVKGQLANTDRNSLAFAYFAAFSGVLLTSTVLIDRARRRSASWLPDSFLKRVIGSVKGLDVVAVLSAFGLARVFGWPLGDYILRYHPFVYMPFGFFFIDAYSMYRALILPKN